MSTLGIIGFGHMAEAIIKGLLEQNPSLYDNILVHELKDTRIQVATDTYSLKNTSLNTLLTSATTILVAIKPQGISGLLESIDPTTHSALWVSILAGTPISQFESKLGKTTKVSRIMPNTPALLGKGMSAIAFNDACTQFDKETITTLFNSIGKTVELPESTLDTVTGISGSGPAFLYRLADQIATCGEENGLDYSTALTLISQTMIGAGHMLQETNTPPQTLIEQVTSPGGTTQAGLETFDTTAIDSEIKSVIQSAINRSKDLSKD